MRKIEQSRRFDAPATGKPTSHQAHLSWSQAVLGILLIAFVIAAAYAALSVYRWTHQVVRSLPATTTVELPQVVLPASAQTPSQPAAVAAPALAAIPQAMPNPAVPLTIEAPEASQRITVLLLGVDQRPDDPSPPRTDNMIVVTFEPEIGRAGMISLPRDLFVPIPGYDRNRKINTAYVIGETSSYPGGGGALAKRTVSEFLGYPIDYYIKVNFEGFERFIDLIGGVDVDVPKTIHDDQYPTIDYGYTTFHVDAGFQHMDGATALRYARTRNADNDFERAKRQQLVLLAIKDQMLQNKLLTTLRVFDLLDVLAGSVEHLSLIHI
jgi:LCP family protein required for cell wall assembly